MIGFMLDEKAIVQTINFASRVIEEKPDLSLKYLCMIPDSYRNHPNYKENIDIIEDDAKRRLRQ